MPTEDLQARCELGQQQLMRTDYLDAEATLTSVESDAWTARDYDTLSRLYMPLQEARRQRRLLCGEGVVCLNLIADGPSDEIDGRRIVENYPHGQLLVAGWKTIQPALRVRALQRELRLYVETFLAAVYPIATGGRAVVIAPLEDVALPDGALASVDELIHHLPAHCIVLNVDELPREIRKGDINTFAEVMSMWERLHTPFLANAEMQMGLVQRIDAYRRAQRVDYGCELAHQKASDAARELAREVKRRGS